MGCTLHIDGNRQFDDATAPDGVDTVGQWADTIASEYLGTDVSGREFSFKADGDVLDRGVKVGKVSHGAFLELIEVTGDAPAEKPARGRAAKDDAPADEAPAAE